MKRQIFVKSYFNGFQDVSNYKKNDAKIKVLAAVKILSCFVILLGFAAIYGAASLYGRVSKKKSFSSHDKAASLTFLEKGTLKNASSTIESSNGELAKKIIAAWGEGNQCVKICSGDFLVDPTDHLVHEMIKRGVGRARNDDGARAFVISQIPGFIEKVSSPDYLTSFAERYFKNDSNKDEIMQVFKKSLLNTEFSKI